jgi:NAD(P)-dependent dehydrogenase (short-subunit alcohol dehydrogenase family)
MAKLDGSKVVVVGGASGVGFAVAAVALEAGAEVVDVTDEASVAAFFEAAGAFDHLVFTAGDWGHMRGPTRDLDIEASKARLEVRFWGAARAAKHAMRQIASDGSISLTGGMLAHRPMPGAPLTTASAHSTEGLALGLARDLAPVRVNAVCLGLILSEQVQGMGEGAIKGFTANLPLPRAGTVEEAAEAYLYLMRASYVTGQVLRVDGGGSLV